MDNATDSFKDYMYRGIDGLLRLTAKAGDSLRVASNNAIEKLDTVQLERKSIRLFRELGEHAYVLLSSGQDVTAIDTISAALVEQIASVSAELSRRGGTEPLTRKKNK